MCLQTEPVLPSQRYLNILQKGATHSQLAREYQAYLQALQHYHAATPGRRIGRFLVNHLLGRPLRFMILKVVPNMQNKFLVWAIHYMVYKLLQSVWVLHDHLMEPVLGSGCHL